MHALHFAEQLRQQQAECCFRPTLDAKSVALAEARRQKGLEVHEALLLVKDGYEAKCEERRRQKQQAEEAECTFKPATNERANEKVVARVTQPPPPKEGRQTTLDREVAEHCTFKPATNDYRGGLSASRTDNPHPHPNPNP